MADHDRSHPEDERYVVRRPEASVLDSQSVVPRDNVVRPPPNRFTHALTADQPFWYDPSAPEDAPDGVIPTGTAVALLVQTGDRCRVVTPAGLYVTVPCTRLRLLPDPPRPAPPADPAGTAGNGT
ncbi:hypothetical protein ACFVHB_39955 [Kitasatospora sp. NPDC127111]|uniref:hypothetical protein n=1 Tax=Kitasatospora sp. NPDC127111 TaxID=3345363 RepID=UPI00362A2AD5